MSEERLKEILFLLHNDKLTGYGKRELETYITDLKSEIERLNNIINELEKWAKEELEQPNWASCGARYMLDKLQELKDSDKE